MSAALFMGAMLVVAIALYQFLAVGVVRTLRGLSLTCWALADTWVYFGQEFNGASRRVRTYYRAHIALNMPVVKEYSRARVEN